MPSISLLSTQLFTGTSLPTAEFAAFLRKTRRVATADQSAWAMLSPEEKTDLLFDFISNFSTSGERIDAAMAIARFIRETIRRDGPCFVMLFDNIDRHPPDQQLDVLLATFGLQQTANVRVLIAMRNTTFARLRSDAAFAFGYITHEGPRPMEIARRRCDAALRNWNGHPLVQAIPVAQAEALRNRISDLAEFLSQSSFNRRQIESLAGDSVRLGLTLCERLVVNALSDTTSRRYTNRTSYAHFCWLILPISSWPRTIGISRIYWQTRCTKHLPCFHSTSCNLFMALGMPATGAALLPYGAFYGA